VIKANIQKTFIDECMPMHTQLSRWYTVFNFTRV